MIEEEGSVVKMHDNDCTLNPPQRPTPDLHAFEGKLVRRRHPYFRIRESPVKTLCPPTPNSTRIKSKSTDKKRPRRVVTYPSPLFLSKNNDEKASIPSLQWVTDIGDGNFARVWLAKDPVENKYYAMKRNKIPILVDSEGHVRLQDAIRNWKTLNDHPHICQLFGAWEDDGIFLNIQMQFCEGGHLFQYLDKCMQDNAGGYSRKLDEKQLWRCLHDATCGLHHLHELGMCHNDIKPENILVGGDSKGQLKLMLADFGHLGMANSLTDGDEGDSVYISHEVLQEGKSSTKGDVFSLGISFFEVISDIYLPTEGDWYQRLRDGDIPQIALHFSNELHDLICNMMHPNPHTRYSCVDILNHPRMCEAKRVSLKHAEYYGSPKQIEINMAFEEAQDQHHTPRHSQSVSKLHRESSGGPWSVAVHSVMKKADTRRDSSDDDFGLDRRQSIGQGPGIMRDLLSDFENMD